MWRPGWIRSIRPPKADRPAAPPASRRDRLALLLAFVTVVCLGAAFSFFKDTRFLMPGALTSAHGGIEKCSTCHTKSGSGQLSWAHGLIAGDPRADSKACLTCHKMPDTAFNAHGAAADVLEKSTQRLTKVAATTPAPRSARAQSIAFPTHDVVEGGLSCATCHQEHQGVNFNLNTISNEQCRSCHAVKFDSFDGNHPKFDNYPFKQRTRIIYDHAGHFGKHYPELAKKDPAKRIPDTCSTCHNSSDDKRVMAVAPFEKTCTGCHLDQITGKERVSGPKGIAFLSLPGLDLQTLKKKNAAIGEWPDASDAALTPFMKVMIGRDEKGRALLKAVDSLNLQDLTEASDDQIKAVTNLVWEIKGLFHALIAGKASDVLADLNIGSGAKLSAGLVADLTASIPRDVVITAHQQWLPNLATEMANRKVTGDQVNNGWSTVTTDSKSAGPASPATLPVTDQRQTTPSVSPQADGRAAEPDEAAGKSNAAESPEELSDTDARPAAPSVSPQAAVGEAANIVKRNPQACIVLFFGQCLLFKQRQDEAEAAQSIGAAGQTDTANAKPDDGPAPGRKTRSAGELPPAMRAGIKYAENEAQPEGEAGTDGTANRILLPSGTPRAIEAQSKDAETAAEPNGAAGKTETAKPDGGKGTPSTTEQPQDKATDQPDTANAKPDGDKETSSANEQPQAGASDQKDDLLFPTDDELRAIKAGSKDSEKSAEPESAAGKTDTTNAKSDGAASTDATAKADTDTAAGQTQSMATPVISIDSDVDPESWAEYGGWYRQDYAIFYRPTGHMDKLIYSWLFLTGPQAPKGDTSPAAAVFDFLTSKDAQGSCTKCHSVDDIQGKGRVVNFSPASVKSKQGRFTNFIHEPHFGIQENSGCLTCHKLENGQPGEAAATANTADVKPDAAVTADAASKANATAPAGAAADSSAAPANQEAAKESSPYLKSYAHGNPQSFVSDFGAVKKDLCQTCHTSGKARQDCLLCHKYHVNDVITPIMTTKNPTQ
jgi:hypothetical protein